MIVLSNWIADHFLLVWLLVTLLFAALAALRGKTDGTPVRPPRSEGLSASPVSVGLFLLFVLGYCWLILWKEDFAFHDNHLLTHWTLQGLNSSPPIWKIDGRFFPLGFQEFNLLRYVTTSPSGFHLFGIVQLLVALALLIGLLRDLPARVRLLIAALVMVTPSVMWSFFGFIYPERNVMFWLMLLLYAYRRFGETRSALHAVIAVVAAQCALYYKEPVFVFVAAFTGAQLLLAWIGGKRANAWYGFRAFLAERRLDVLLLALAGLFLLQFALVILPHTNFGYTADNSIGRLATLGEYGKCNPWLTVLFVTLIARAVHLARSRQRPEAFWDALGLASGLHAAFYLALGMFAEYYVAPTELLAAAYLGRLAYGWLRTRSSVATATVAAALLFVVVQNVPHSFVHVVERKAWIGSHMRLASFLEERSSPEAVTLFSPYTDPYPLMLASTYLEYRGLRPARGDLRSAAAGVDFLFTSPHAFQGLRCVAAWPHGACEHAPAPKSGDWIVILPDDTVPAEELSALAERTTLLLHHRPRGQVAAKTLMDWLLIHPIPEGWHDLWIFEVP